MNISNTDNTIDSRDIMSRIEELENDIDSFIEDYMEENNLSELDDNDVPEEETDFWDNKGELRVLTKLQEEGEAYYSDWNYGIILIHEDYFVEYCEELCKDIGAIPFDVPSYIEIDWEATSENIKADYDEIDFDGEAYYVRR